MLPHSLKADGTLCRQRIHPLSNEERMMGDDSRTKKTSLRCCRIGNRLPEKLLCLTYISFIQETIVARLHTLLISIAALFSLVTLGFAVYPFAPFFPLLVSGLVLFTR